MSGRVQRRWRGQPNSALRSQGLHGSGLLALWNPRVSLRFGGDYPTTVGGTLATSESSACADFASTKMQFPFNNFLANGIVTSAGMAFLALVDVDTLSGYGCIFSSEDTTTQKCTEIRIGSAATDSKIWVTRGTSAAPGNGAYRGFDSGANRISAGDRNVRILISFADNDVQTVPILIINGTQYTMSASGSGVATGTVAAPTSNGVSLGGRSADTVTPMDGRIKFAALWGRGLSVDAGIRYTKDVDSPYQLVRPKRRRVWAVSSGTSDIAASGGAVAGGSADLSVSYSLAAVAVAVAGGSAALNVDVPLSAAALTVAGGSADASVTVSIAASALAVAAGSAGLSVTVTLAASGGAVSGGAADLSVSSGDAIAASGGAIASGSALLSATVQIGAAGLAQALGSGALSVAIPLAAFGAAVAGGQATLSAGATGAGPLILAGSARLAATLSSSARLAATLHGSVGHA